MLANLLRGVCFLLVLTMWVLAQSSPGMVLELRGELATEGKTRIGIFNLLSTGKSFELSKGGMAKLGKSGTNRQWQLQGPLTFRMTDEGPVKSSSSGSIVELERQVTRVTTPLKSVDISRTGGVRRSMLWVTSDPGQLTATPTITWETAAKFDAYLLELQDDQTNPVYSTKLPGDASSVRLPASVALQPGATYFIHLQGQQGARGYTCNGRLRVVTDDEARVLAESLKTYREEFDKTGDLSFLSLSVLELATLEIYSQLPALLQEMAVQRPDDPSITAIIDRLKSNQQKP